MQSEPTQPLVAEMEGLDVPDHAVPTNTEAAKRLIAEIRARYQSISEKLRELGKYAEASVREQVLIMTMDVQTYSQHVILQGEAEAIRLNEESIRKHLDLIDTKRERAIAKEFVGRINELIKKIELDLLQRAERT